MTIPPLLGSRGISLNTRVVPSQNATSGYQVPAHVAWVDGTQEGLGEELYLTMVPDGTTVLLKDTARLIWLVAAEGGDVLPEVADLVGLPPAEIAKDVNRFLTELIGRGLLTDPEGYGTAPDAPRAGAPGPSPRLPSPGRRTMQKVRRHAQMRLDRVVALTARRLDPAPRAAAWDGDPRIALLTVNFSTTHYLKLMLLTLAEQNDLDLLQRIVICDNGSRDDPEPFFSELEARVARVTVTRNARPLSHARGMRSALRALRAAERDEPKPANILLFCDTDVVFRNPVTLRAIADRFVDNDVAFVGELRQHVFPYPEAQASFLAVRRDWAERRRTAPWVDHGSPAYWLQRSIWQQGGRGDDFPSNAGGYILHRGRSGVAAGQAFVPERHFGGLGYASPHFMGVPDAARVWYSVESRHDALLAAPDGSAVACAIGSALVTRR